MLAIVECRNCRCWFDCEEPYGPAAGEKGDCRRHAPLPRPWKGCGVQLYTWWPITSDKEGCFDGIPREEPKPELPPDINIEQLGLGTRAVNCLLDTYGIGADGKYNSGVQPSIGTLHELLQCTKADLFGRMNLGKVTLKEIEDCLAKRGLSLKGEPKP